jgi:hypothetical protein
MSEALIRIVKTASEVISNDEDVKPCVSDVCTRHMEERVREASADSGIVTYSVDRFPEMNVLVFHHITSLEVEVEKAH